MPLAYDVDNYLYGKGRLYFKKTGTTGYLDLGNIPKFTVNMELTKEDHFSSRSGTKEKDKTIITEKKCNSEFELEEYSADNLDLAFMGDGVQTGAQVAGSLDGVSTTTVDDKYVSLGKTDVSITKISHGTVTSGPFVAGTTVTNGTASAEIAWVGSGFIEVIKITGGAFATGDTLTVSSISATATGVEVLQDVCVTDHATVPTKRYALGTDYTVDTVEGMIRELSTGTIAAHTCFVSANYAAKTTNSVRALANSSCSGELLFVGDPDVGPRWRIQAWSVDLTIGGEAGFISDAITPIPITADILSDATNHPSEPFFRATESY